MASTVASSVPGFQGVHVSFNRIIPVGALTIVLAVIANLVVQAIGRRVVDISPAFEPLASAQPIIIFTAIGVGVGVAVFALIVRRSPRPLTLFRSVATAALIVSLIPDLLLIPGVIPSPGVSVGAVVILLVMHVVAYLITVGVLTTFTGPAAQ
jgi:Family of unknown function (DUF6069)